MCRAIWCLVIPCHIVGFVIATLGQTLAQPMRALRPTLAPVPKSDKAVEMKEGVIEAPVVSVAKADQIPPPGYETLLQPKQVDIPHGLSNIHLRVRGRRRRFLLFMPKRRWGAEPLPLWILAPGRGNSPEFLLNMTGFVQFAEKHTFALAVLEGAQKTLNVGLHSQAFPNRPDDVAYVRAVLRNVVKKVKIDMNRIPCTGYSCGARFCVRLASELSSFVSAIAPVSGIRFPRPNNATRPMPIIAFHGTGDPINPFFGRGPPAYWYWSVKHSVQSWATFNGCKHHSLEQVSREVRVSKHTGCTDDADVTLVQIDGGGHAWPGSSVHFQKRFQFGVTTHDIDAREVMWRFFEDHPRKSTSCHTAVEGEQCQLAVASAIQRHRNERRPESKENLMSMSTYREFQAGLHKNIAADCPPPCPFRLSTNEHLHEATHAKNVWPLMMLVVITACFAMAAMLAYSCRANLWGLYHSFETFSAKLCLKAEGFFTLGEGRE